MKYPVFWRKFNEAIGIIAGILALVIAALSVFEAIARYVFEHPTSWSLNVCCYILVWSIFLGSAFAFQQGGHVGVDMLLEYVDKHCKSEKRLPRRIMAIIGNIMTCIFMIVILYGILGMCKTALEFHSVTIATNPIPIIWLYLGVVIGTILMIVTLIFIILDLISGDDKYL